MEKGEYKKCPECEKSVKHLLPHLRNKHKLRTANFKDGAKGLEKIESDTISPTQIEPTKMDADFKDSAKELEKIESHPVLPSTPEPAKMDADFKDGAKELEKIKSHPGHPPTPVNLISWVHNRY